MRQIHSTPILIDWDCQFLTKGWFSQVTQVASVKNVLLRNNTIVPKQAINQSKIRRESESIYSQIQGLIKLNNKNTEIPGKFKTESTLSNDKKVKAQTHQTKDLVQEFTNVENGGFKPGI